MKTWVSHPTGNSFVRALLAELDQRKHDFDYFTTLGFAGRSGAVRRRYKIPRERLHTFPGREIGRLIYQQLRKIAPPPASSFSVENIYKALDRRVAGELARTKEKPEWIHAYEDGALESFRAAENLGIARVYELPIAFWETAWRLLAEEVERYPNWAKTLPSRAGSQGKLERKTEELRRAEVVVCPSEFVYDSLPESVRSTKRCLVSPFGSPDLPASTRRECSGILRLLFAGSMTQRKGLADLFAALRLLKRVDVELTIVGAPAAPMEFYRNEFSHFHYEKPRSHAGMFELMRRADVLVLPSIVEGRALVQQEALACGLPLIVTPNAGGEDLIEEGRTGFLVPIRSPEIIAERIEWFAEHRSALPEMSEACRRKAASYTWRDYAGRILDALEQPSSEPAAILEAAQ